MVSVGSSCTTEPGELARFKDGQERMQTINLVNVATEFAQITSFAGDTPDNDTTDSVVFTQ
jgi:hypothetical protein